MADAGADFYNVKTVLFDIGNVLASDYWESLWLTKHYGLADQLRIPPYVAAQLGAELWKSYSVKQSSEGEYWEEFSRAVGRIIPEPMIRKVESAVIKTNPFASIFINQLNDMGIALGIVSNNTSFWWPKQLELADLAGCFHDDVVFVSCDYGVEKCGTEHDLFSFAAAGTNAASTLIIDDRKENIERAADLGFQAFLYDRRSIQNIGVKGNYYSAPPFALFNLGVHNGVPGS